MIRHIRTWFGLLPTGLLLAGCATVDPVLQLIQEGDDGRSTSVEFTQPVHFSTAEGTIIAVSAGSYDVRVGGATTLQLHPSSGSAALSIAATPSSHRYRVGQNQPLAVVMPGDEDDTQYLLLVQADGTALEAVGSYSGIQTRAPGLRISPGSSQLFVEAKAYTSSAQSRVTGPVEAGPQAPAVSASVVITAGPNVSNYQECAGLTGYVSSIVTMRIVSRLQDDRPMVAHGETTVPRIVLTGSPMQLPPQSVPSDVSYPNTPFMRIFPNNPYRCMFGSVTVATRNLMAGSKVRLTMTVHDLTPRRGTTIADTYELPMTSSGIVTFGKVVIGSVSLQGVSTDRTDYTTFVMNALRVRAPNGVVVKVQASVDGGPSGTRECLYKPVMGAPGVGTLTCK